MARVPSPRPRPLRRQRQLLSHRIIQTETERQKYLETIKLNTKAMVEYVTDLLRAPDFSDEEENCWFEHPNGDGWYISVSDEIIHLTLQEEIPSFITTLLGWAVINKITVYFGHKKRIVWIGTLEENDLSTA